jgi:hypothetical protein
MPAQGMPANEEIIGEQIEKSKRDMNLIHER